MLLLPRTRTSSEFVDEFVATFRVKNAISIVEDGNGLKIDDVLGQ
ncbi:hypothetical protein [Halorubrum trapanicum]